MADLHLVTGYQGIPHVTAADQGALNAYTVGTGEYILTKGRCFEAEIIDNNTVRIHDGSAMIHGRYITLDAGSYIDQTIENGTSGMKRHDVILLRYSKSAQTGIEQALLLTAKGTATTGDAVDPSTIFTGANILNGNNICDIPLYRVVLEGLSIVRVEPLFQMLAPMADFQHKQNLLINGDFQCNQRGAKTYTQDGTAGYSVDMWRAYNVKVEVRNDGVKLSGLAADKQGYFTQFIQLGKLETTTYTICAMVDGKRCIFTVTPGGTAKEKDFGKFKISTLTTSTWDDSLPQYNYYNNKLKINICPNGTNSVIINYVDVFEGTVAYPHVKEDPAIALMRCRRYLQTGTQLSPYMWYKDEDDGTAYRCVLSHEPMAKTPTLEYCSGWYYTEKSSYLGVLKTNISVLDEELTMGTSLTNVLHLKVVIVDPTYNGMHERCFGFSLHYRISCEPTDA